MGLSSLRLAVPLAAVVLSFSMSASAQDGAPPPVAPATPAAPAAAPAAPAAEAAPTERTANNVIYIEGLGPGLLYSLNYERVFQPVSVRLGVDYFSISATNADGSSASATFLAIPITISYLGLGSLKHMFEIGAGGSILYFGGAVNTLGNTTHGSAVSGLGTIILGYRYQPPDGGFFLKAGLSPLITGSGSFLPWPYVGLGATF